MGVVLGDVAHGRHNNFNMIRVLAASGVIFSHAYPLALGPEAQEPFEGLLKGDNLGRFCVFVFFATSGFFITASYQRCRSVWDFVLARVLRIYPALFVMACIMFVVLGVSHTVDWSYWESVPFRVVETVTMFVNFNIGSNTVFFPDNPFPGAINGSLWTLRFEVLCYVGVLIAGLSRVFETRWLALALALGCVGLNVVVPMLTGRFDIRLLSYVGLPFAFGSVAWVWRDYIRLDWRYALLGFLGVVVFYSTPLFFAALNLCIVYWVLWLGYGQFPLIGYYRRVGDYSYGIYIYAFPVQQFVAQSGIVMPIWNAVLSLLITLVLAILSWRFVEKPALSLRSRFYPRVHEASSKIKEAL